MNGVAPGTPNLAPSGLSGYPGGKCIYFYLSKLKMPNTINYVDFLMKHIVVLQGVVPSPVGGVVVSGLGGF